jgi:hypothetical protein
MMMMMTTTTKTVAAEVPLSGGAGVQNNSPHGNRQHGPPYVAVRILHNSISHDEQRDAVRYISYKVCFADTCTRAHWLVGSVTTAGPQMNPQTYAGRSISALGTKR